MRARTAPSLLGPLRGRAPLVALGLGAAVASGDPPSVPVERDADIARFQSDVVTLTDPEMGGRLPGEPGIDMAASFIIERFERLGLEPAFPTTSQDESGVSVLTPRATFRQPMEIGADARVTAAVVTVAGEPLTMNQDYTVLGMSASGEFEGACTFVGYSIVAGAAGYLGYPPTLNLEGQAALCLRFEPMDELGRSRWADEGWTRHSVLTAKVVAAQRRGAGAVIVVTPPDADDERVGRLAETSETLEGQGYFEIPVIMVTPEVADRIVAGGDPDRRSLHDLKRLADEGSAIIELPDVEVSINVTINASPLTTDNLGAVLPGRGALADEYVVIGGHYDHIGTGEWGATDPTRAGQIHPGADDNASGAAGVLLAAELLSRAYALLPEDQPARSILFLPFTAEESGLEGSRHYLESPIVPVESHAFLLNMDMVGRMEDGFMFVAGVGSGEGLEELAQTHFTRSGLAITTAPGIESGRSDHTSFDAKKIPFLHFTTGPHDEYHTPDDRVELINAEGGVRVVSLLSDIALEIATRDEKMAYTGETLRRGMRRADDGRPRVRVGIAPAARSPEPGVLVTRVFDDGPADDAGLQSGDRIVRWDGEDIPDVQAWAARLLTHEPGQTVSVRVVRDGREIEFQLRLGESD